MFVLVIAVGVLGFLHDSWPKEAQSFWINVRAVVGIVLWVTLLARYGYRRLHVPPPLPDGTSTVSRRAAPAVHLTLYALLFITPLFGMVTFFYHGRILDFGLFKMDFGIQNNRAIFHPTEDIHGYLAYAIFTLAGLHAAAALWHQFIMYDALIQRIWPVRRRGHSGAA